MTPALPPKGIVDKPSSHSVEQTVDRLKNILQSKGVMLFALIGVFLYFSFAGR